MKASKQPVGRAQLNAGMFPIVLMISTVITLLITALIGLSYYRNLLLTRERIQTDLHTNVRSGINLLLSQSLRAEEENILTGKALRVDLFGQGKDSVELTLKPWGLFNLALAKAFRGNYHLSKALLVGTLPDTLAKASIYLADQKRPLTLTGNTRLTGQCYLPQAGIRTTYVEGKGFTGTLPKQMDQKLSKEHLPALSDAFAKRIQYYQNLSQSNAIHQHRLSPLLTLAARGSYSFFDQARIFSVEKSIALHANLSGNLILHSPNSIVLSKDCTLENVLIVARRVIVENGFKGQVQILARDTVVVQSGAYLAYPSVICLNGQSSSYLSVESMATVEGIVLQSGSLSSSPNQLTSEQAFAHRLVVGNKALIRGFIYCDGLGEFSGILQGSLWARRLFYKAPDALYENYLHDAQISASQRPDSFLTSALLSKQAARLLVWLE